MVHSYVRTSLFITCLDFGQLRLSSPSVTSHTGTPEYLVCMYARVTPTQTRAGPRSPFSVLPQLPRSLLGVLSRCECRILVDLIMHWKHWHHSHQNFLWEQASKPAVPSVSVKQTRRSNTKSLITRTETNCSLDHALCAFIPYTQRFNISTIVGYGSIQVANTSSHIRG